MRSPLFVLFGLIGLVCAAPSSLQISTFSTTSSFSEPASVSVSVPAGYKLVGCGFSGSSYYIRSFYPSNNSTCFIEAYPVVGDQGPSTVVGYALGLYDPSNNFATHIFAGSSSGTTTATASVSVTDGYTLTGGGGSSTAFLTSAFPNTVRGDATSTKMMQASATCYPGFCGSANIYVTAWAIGIKPTGTGYTVGQLVSSSASVDSAVNGNQQRVTATAAPLAPTATTSGGGFRGDRVFTSSSYPTNSGWASTGTNAPTTTSESELDSYDVALTLSVQSASPSTSSSGSSSSGTTTGTSTSTCSGVTATQTVRTTWTSDSVTYYLYDITVTNSRTTATSSTSEPALVIASADGSALDVSQTWNLVNDASTVPSKKFVALTQGTTIAAGSSYTSAGYVSNKLTTISAYSC